MTTSAPILISFSVQASHPQSLVGSGVASVSPRLLAKTTGE
jgi:hypothetical protein